MTAPDDPTLAELGEAGLIQRLAAFAAAGQLDDDAASLVLAGTLVVNTDLLVEGVHFSAATTDAFHVGWRAAAANLSDLAAMGCWEGLGVTVGLVAPASTPWSWVEQVYQGLTDCLAGHGGGVLLGGDCSGGVSRTLAVTALGMLPEAGGPIRRRDGRAGDILVCTGLHGLSRLGLAVLQQTLPVAEREGLDPGLVRRAVQAHRMPVPRFDVVRALQRCRPAGLPWRVGGTDSSDGLAAAAVAVAQASGCRAVLERTALPLHLAMTHLESAEPWCLTGGEDFELLLALEPAWAEALLREPLPDLRAVGRLVSAPSREGCLLCWEDGGEAGAEEPGFRHFGSGPQSP